VVELGHGVRYTMAGQPRGRGSGRSTGAEAAADKGLLLGHGLFLSLTLSRAPEKSQ